MKIQTFFFTAAAATFAGLLAFSGSAFALRPGCESPPCGGSIDDGGAPDLGDLIVLNRDEWGLPILVGDLCQQPLAAPGVTLPAVGDIPACVPAPDESCLIPVDPDTCAVVVGYETYTQEVDFGRTSVIRSPISVIEQSLGEVITKLATAQCTSLDPAGRLVNTSEIDDLVLSATIDSPLENLAIYRQLMLTGYLGADATAIVLPDTNVLNMAARGFGAAVDKTGKVTKDQVVYSNEIMGLTDESVQTYLPKICMNVREEVQGTVQSVRKCFLNYGSAHPTYENVVGSSGYASYGYDRADNFSTAMPSLPFPAYIPMNGPMDGWFEYLALYPDATTMDGDPLFQILQGPILDSVFCLDDEGEPVVPEGGVCADPDSIDPGFEAGNVGGFAQAADDTREVIEFTHDRPMPLGYETPVPMCDDPAVLSYDLTFPEQSGFQVPKNYVNGGEREFFVTVSNAAGTVPASGTLNVLAENSDKSLQLGVWNFEFSDLPVGQTVPFTALFTITTTSPTIEWTATVVGTGPGTDLNEMNNIREATSTVKATSGGGQGGNPN